MFAVPASISFFMQYFSEIFLILHRDEDERED